MAMILCNYSNGNFGKLISEIRWADVIVYPTKGKYKGEDVISFVILFKDGHPEIIHNVLEVLRQDRQSSCIIETVGVWSHVSTNGVILETNLQKEWINHPYEKYESWTFIPTDNKTVPYLVLKMES